MQRGSRIFCEVVVEEFEDDRMAMAIIVDAFEGSVPRDNLGEGQEGHVHFVSDAGSGQGISREIGRGPGQGTDGAETICEVITRFDGCSQLRNSEVALHPPFGVADDLASVRDDLIVQRFRVPDRGSGNPTPLGGMGLAVIMHRG
jgi:hypothetical protein